MSYEDAERHLRSLELFGMRFGLDRMRLLMTELGSPEKGFASVHVVGTNGKSSTARMIAAILQRHDLRVGAYLSPHLVSFAQPFLGVFHPVLIIVIVGAGAKLDLFDLDGDLFLFRFVSTFFLLV